VQRGESNTYLGQYTHSVDEKGRVSLPSRFRDGEAGQTFVATRGIGPCLFLYPEAAWSKVVDRLDRQKARTDPEQRRFFLQLMQNTVETTIDSQGRISIPPRLAELAGIEREVVFVGAGEVIEMWNPARYAEYVGPADRELDQWLERFL
jgi:MraZ protein